MKHNTLEFRKHKEQIVIDKLTELLLVKIDDIKSKFDNIVNIDNNFKLIHFEFDNFKQSKKKSNLLDSGRLISKRLTCVCIIHVKYPNTIFMIGSNHKNGVYIRKCATYGGYRLNNENIIYSSVIINDKIDIFLKYNLTINYINI
jgi:hypothetical protein